MSGTWLGLWPLIRDGEILEKAEYLGEPGDASRMKVFGFRAAFHLAPGGERQPERGVDPDDEIPAPVRRARARMVNFASGVGEGGRYNLTFLQHCVRIEGAPVWTPGDVPVAVEVALAGHDPQRAGAPRFTQFRSVHVGCVAGLSQHYQVDFRVDVIQTRGDIAVANGEGEPAAITDGGAPEYALEAAGDERTTLRFDFNGDGEEDTVVQTGRVPVEDEAGDPVPGRFRPESPDGDANGDWLAVYFSDSEREPGEDPPDLWRRAHRPVHGDTGELVSLDRESLRDTDLYIFRASDGSLIAQREGLSDEAVETLRWEALRRGEMAATDRNRVHAIGVEPLNLRVWAECFTEVEHGLDRGEERFLIAHEGAGTHRDHRVALMTEWRAQDGSALPEALGRNQGADLGLKGQVSIVREQALQSLRAQQGLDTDPEPEALFSIRLLGRIRG